MGHFVQAAPTLGEFACLMVRLGPTIQVSFTLWMHQMGVSRLYDPTNGGWLVGRACRCLCLVRTRWLWNQSNQCDMEIVMPTWTHSLDPIILHCMEVSCSWIFLSQSYFLVIWNNLRQSLGESNNWQQDMSVLHSFRHFLLACQSNESNGACEGYYGVRVATSANWSGTQDANPHFIL